ncbi:RES family NAD+ phosphorylase [Shewanella litorisediminis]|uniref:RES family NAD+ phosphorylase n=1 Tax=Shewanella litorisediminis TaxID=1173586 RepID=A0ABX7G1M4_9GAMM|nr:RES family NAD+ phosphorylase [Shewanella litorisediminis]MCL2920033.1 RES family NAD+ phosphorylase [Shewanella litorisediminis]QRH01167.1 RES family NAD+ phosphorylase [Shewanella litorisediminis]
MDLLSIPAECIDLPYEGSCYRLVESQEEAATLSLVDNFDEQMLLESLLDGAKPPYREGTAHLHYLLKTPFRYPPLRHGSRFGTRLMPSFFYGSESAQTCLTEVAYYRFIFLQDMAVPYQGVLHSEHMMFRVLLSAVRCADLTRIADGTLQQQLTHGEDYRFTQALGQQLLDRHCQLIRSYSAREPGGVNLAVADPGVMASGPLDQTYWICQLEPARLAFTERGRGHLPRYYEVEAFYREGRLPRPA